MLREERICTHTCVNILVPLSVYGMVITFIPSLIVLMPVSDQDVCFWYFLTHAPYPMNDVATWFYILCIIMNFVVMTLELVYFRMNIYKMQ
jgi:uncharacterized membrane protein YciS (DUF1049 family)